MVQYKFLTPAGPLYIHVSDGILVGLFWKPNKSVTVKSLNQGNKDHKLIQNVVTQLDQYFKGQRKEFKIKLNPQGTEFQKKVWHEISQIPFGRTVTYAHIAHKIKSKAIRAIGTAIGKNPMSIVVPCHRVIRSDGSLGGYNGGLKAKTKLLSIEFSRT